MDVSVFVKWFVAENEAELIVVQPSQSQPPGLTDFKIFFFYLYLYIILHSTYIMYDSTKSLLLAKAINKHPEFYYRTYKQRHLIVKMNN